jgi:predicted aspartyl protease
MEIPIRILEIDQMGYHLLIEAKVNNLKANVLVDTGASRTVIDLNRLEHFFENPQKREYGKPCSGVGSGRIESFVTTLHTLQLGMEVIENIEVVAIDLSTVNQNYAMFDLPRIDMVLGSDLLLKLKAVIDYSNKILSLKP